MNATKDIGLAPPAILALYRYCAEAPAIVCEEGYWDDQESANADGMNQEKSYAADLMRAALRSLGYEPPEGLETCEDCYRTADIGCSSQCQHSVEEDEDDEEEIREDHHQPPEPPEEPPYCDRCGLYGHDSLNCPEG